MTTTRRVGGGGLGHGDRCGHRGQQPLGLGLGLEEAEEAGILTLRDGSVVQETSPAGSS